MTTITANHPNIAVSSPPIPVVPPARHTLASATAAASEVAGRVSLDDPRWEVIGPLLTAFVDAASRAGGRPGSPIEPDEIVPPALRLRDLARLARITVAGAGTAVTATAQIEQRLWSLQAAAALR